MLHLVFAACRPVGSSSHCDRAVLTLPASDPTQPVSVINSKDDKQFYNISIDISKIIINTNAPKTENKDITPTRKRVYRVI